MFYNSAEGDQSNQGDTWYEIASQTGTLHAGQHFIWVYAEYGGVQTNRTAHIRVLVDGTERGYDYHTPDAGEYKAFSVFGMLNVAVEAEHTISLEIRGGAGSQTVNVRRIRLVIEKE